MRIFEKFRAHAATFKFLRWIHKPRLFYTHSRISKHKQYIYTQFTFTGHAARARATWPDADGSDGLHLTLALALFEAGV